MDPTHLARLPILPFLDPRLIHAPGMLPLDPADWLLRDAAFEAQMALRDSLVAQDRATVFAQLPEGEAASAELLETVLTAIRSDPAYGPSGRHVTRPDGLMVDLDADAALATLGRLVQEDFLVLEKDPGADEHRLTGGILCFPSRWSLAEKMARGLVGIHAPVPFYATSLAPRVQRFFDVIRPERPLWRANWVLHTYPELFQPSRTLRHSRDFTRGEIWLRVERQALRRLPRTGAVIFSIKTDIAHLDSLAPDEGARLAAEIAALPEPEFSYKGGVPLRDRLMARFGAGVTAARQPSVQ